MALLHPQECYLLEQLSSSEYFAATRDAIFAFIDAHEAVCERLQKELPVRIRSEPFWKQGDMVWGSRVLPNIRGGRERYIQAYILRTHNDPEAFYKVSHTMSNYSRLCADNNVIPMLNTPYRAFLTDGSVFEGMSDGKGYTKLFTSAQIQDVLL